MIEVKFYETYYFCNIINNVLNDQFSFLTKLHEFYGDEDIFYLVKPFDKNSAFHKFIEFIVDDIYFEKTTTIDLDRLKQSNSIKFPLSLQLKCAKLPIELAFDFHKIEYESFFAFLEDSGKIFESADMEDVYTYMVNTRFVNEYDELLARTTKEIFHVLFQNRNLMLLFNDMLSRALHLNKDSDIPLEYSEFFSRQGVLARKAIPKWVKQAVYFRDKGRCVLCDKDLSGTVNLKNIENYDHIIPLAQHGFNDVTNIQLLCKECNQIEKKDKYVVTSNKYQSWYSYDE